VAFDSHAHGWYDETEKLYYWIRDDLDTLQTAQQLAMIYGYLDWYGDTTEIVGMLSP
jgi:hypothetical protein